MFSRSITNLSSFSLKAQGVDVPEPGQEIKTPKRNYNKKKFQKNKEQDTPVEGINI